MPLNFVGAPAELRHLNIRKEGPEDDKVLAVDLKLQVILDSLYLQDFDPLLEGTLFTLRDGNWAVQFPQMGPIHWSGELQHMELRFGAIEISDAKVHRFEIEPEVSGAGKYITLRCSASFKPRSGRTLALLAELVGEGTKLSMEPQRDLLTEADKPVDAKVELRGPDGEVLWQSPATILTDAANQVREEREREIAAAEEAGIAASKTAARKRGRPRRINVERTSL